MKQRWCSSQYAENFRHIVMYPSWIIRQSLLWCGSCLLPHLISQHTWIVCFVRHSAEEWGEIRAPAKRANRRQGLDGSCFQKPAGNYAICQSHKDSSTSCQAVWLVLNLYNYREIQWSSATSMSSKCGKNRAWPLPILPLDRA